MNRALFLSFRNVQSNNEGGKLKVAIKLMFRILIELSIISHQPNRNNENYFTEWLLGLKKIAYLKMHIPDT